MDGAIPPSPPFAVMACTYVACILLDVCTSSVSEVKQVEA